jgi:3'-5' exoribonuclease
MFPEALLLHYMDDLDSKVESMRAHFAKDLSDLEWTGYNASLGRPLLNTKKFLAKIKAVEPKADAAIAGTNEEE